MKAAIASAVVCASLLAGCGDGGVTERAPSAEAPASNQAEAPTNHVRPAPRQPLPPAELPPQLRGSSVPPQLEPLGHDEIESSGLLGAGCDFTVGEQVLLVAVEGEAIVRVGGRVMHLYHFGPLGSTGGFFGGREIRISVGRTEGAEEARDEGASWPARIAVTTPWAGQPSRVEGRWTCGS